MMNFLVLQWFRKNYIRVHVRSYVYVHVYVKTQRTCSHLHGGHKEHLLMELVHRGFFFFFVLPSWLWGIKPGKHYKMYVLWGFDFFFYFFLNSSRAVSALHATPCIIELTDSCVLWAVFCCGTRLQKEGLPWFCHRCQKLFLGKVTWQRTC